MVKTIEERVKTLVVDNLGVSDEQITPNASLADDLGANSLDVVELVMTVEEEFEIEIPNEQAEELKTVGLLIEYVTRRVGKKETL